MIIKILTGEFVLDFTPNGGTAVLIRSLFVTILMYSLAIGLKSYSAPDATLSFSLIKLREEVNATIPWLGAIFGGTYAALYSRFSSQWSYLADLYNQQMLASISLSENTIAQNNFTLWQSAFVEDAINMHLATKKGFSNAVFELLNDPPIRFILESKEHFGKEKIDKLYKKLKNIIIKSPATKR